MLRQSLLSKWASMITLGLSIFGMVVFCVSAGILIPQALRTQAEAQSMPPRSRDSLKSVVQSSWILGITSSILALAWIVGVVLVFQKRLLVTWAILCFCVVVFLILTI